MPIAEPIGLLLRAFDVCRSVAFQVVGGSSERRAFAACDEEPLANPARRVETEYVC